MVEVAQRRTVSQESGEVIGSYHFYTSERHAPVLKCYYPNCSKEATQLCNQCGEVFCSEHSTLRRRARSTVIFYKCSFCVSKARKPVSRVPVIAMFAIIGLVSMLLLWHAYAA